MGWRLTCSPSELGPFPGATIPAAFSRMPGAVTGFHGCVCVSTWMCKLYVAPVQQKYVWEVIQ